MGMSKRALAVALLLLASTTSQAFLGSSALVDPDAGLTPNAFGFQSSRSVCVDPATGNVWVFYLKRILGAVPEYRIVARTWGAESVAVFAPAPDFSISCRPPYVWLATADSDAIRVLWRKGVMSGQAINWGPPVVVGDSGISFGAQTPAIAWLADGRPVLVAWGNDRQGSIFHTYASVARDPEGQSWGPPAVLVIGGPSAVSGQISVTVFAVGFGAGAITLQPCDCGAIPRGAYINWYLGGDSWSGPYPLPFPVIASQISAVTDSAGTAHLLYAASSGQAEYVTVTPSGVSQPTPLGATGIYEACVGLDGDDVYAFFGRIFAARKPAGGSFGPATQATQVFTLRRQATGYTFTQCEERAAASGAVWLAWSEGPDNNVIMAGAAVW